MCFQNSSCRYVSFFCSPQGLTAFLPAQKAPIAVFVFVDSVTLVNDQAAFSLKKSINLDTLIFWGGVFSPTCEYDLDTLLSEQYSLPLLIAQFPQDAPDLLLIFLEEHHSSEFWCKHNVVPAIPFRMCQAIIGTQSFVVYIAFHCFKFPTTIQILLMSLTSSKELSILLLNLLEWVWQ